MDTPGIALYPLSLPSLDSLIRPTNRAQTTLDGAIDASTLTVKLLNASLFPNTGVISIDDEILVYTGNSSNILTIITRGAEGTIATSHLNSAIVQAKITAKTHSVVHTEIISLATKLGTGSSTASANTVLRGAGLGITDFGQISDAYVSSGAAITWTKISKTGSSLADFATRSAADLSSGTLSDSRLSSNIPLKNTSNIFSVAQYITQLITNKTFGEKMVIYGDGGTDNYSVSVANNELRIITDTSAAHISFGYGPYSSFIEKFRMDNSNGRFTVPTISATTISGGTLSLTTAISDIYISSSSNWNSKQAGDADLTALSSLSGAGLAIRTGSDTWTLRSINVDDNLQIVNGDGVLGNPTIELGENIPLTNIPNLFLDTVSFMGTDLDTQKYLNIDVTNIDTIDNSPTYGGYFNVTGKGPIYGLHAGATTSLDTTPYVVTAIQAVCSVLDEISSRIVTVIDASINNNGSINTAYGIKLSCLSSNSIGNITTLYGIYLNDWTATTTNSYGIYLGSGIDVGTTRYAIYSASTSPSILAGQLTISGLLKAGSLSTTLTDSSGKILSSALNIVQIGQGGTGQTGYIDGEILIGNSLTSGLSRARIIAGSGITITNGHGSITIDASFTNSTGGVLDSTISFSDITIGNASTTKHGFLRKLSGSSSDALLGDGTWGPLIAGASISLSNLSSVSINTSLLPSSAGVINIGGVNLPFAHIYFSGTSDSASTNYFKLTGASASGLRTVMFPDNDTNIAICNKTITWSGLTQNRTFILPDASATILTNNSPITVGQGGTNSTSTSGARAALGLVIGSDVLSPTGSGANLSSLNASALSSGIISIGVMPALSGDVSTSSGSISTTINTNVVTDTKIRQSAGLAVIGNSTNAIANVGDIVASTDGNILRRSGSSIGFGSINLSQSGTVGTSILSISNGGTGASGQNFVDLTTNQNVSGNKIFASVPTFIGNPETDPAQGSTTTATMFRGADGSSSTPITSNNPSIYTQTFRTGGTHGTAMFGFLQNFQLSGVSQADTYGSYILARISPNMVSSPSGSYFHQAFRSYNILNPSNYTPGLHTIIGYGAWIQGETQVTGVGAFGAQIDSNNMSGVDAAHENFSSSFKIANIATNYTSNANASAIIYSQGYPNNSAYKGWKVSTNAVIRHILDFSDAYYTLLTTTIAVTGGSQNVVGTSSKFLTDLVIGDQLQIAGVYYTVSTISDNTHLTITPAYAGVTASGITPAKYVIPMRLGLNAYITVTPNGTTEYRMVGMDSSSTFRFDSDARGVVFGGIVQITSILQMGGATSGEVALKRSLNTLQIRLGDDSGYATIDALSYKVSGTAFAASNLSNGVVGSGSVVLATTPIFPSYISFGTNTIGAPSDTLTTGWRLINYEGGAGSRYGFGIEAGYQWYMASGGQKFYVSASSSPVIALTIESSAAATFASSISATSFIGANIYGGTATGSTLSLNGTNNGSSSNAYILMNPVVSGTFPGTVGIGMPSSSFISGTVLGLQASNTLGGILLIDSYTTGLGPSILQRSAAGTAASPTATAKDQPLASLVGRGYQTSSNAFTTANNARISLVAHQAFTSAAQGTYITLETTPLSSVTNNIKMVLGGEHTLTDAATDLFDIALPTGTVAGGLVIWTIQVNDGTNFQAFTGTNVFSAVNKAGSFTTNISDHTVSAVVNSKSVSSGTLTAAFTFNNGTNKVTFRVTPAGSLTETSYKITYTVINNSPQAITIL